ncbi:hypothetical protein ACTMSW_08755 [Micromonospora sp. BQ11]|uniref:hypothetical protein n=1 Tax=Micromonospora sp. BQ11 TaxID=3452212 RepID=UPI003F886338
MRRLPVGAPLSLLAAGVVVALSLGSCSAPPDQAEPLMDPSWRRNAAQLLSDLVVLSPAAASFTEPVERDATDIVAAAAATLTHPALTGPDHPTDLDPRLRQRTVATLEAGDTGLRTIVSTNADDALSSAALRARAAESMSAPGIVSDATVSVLTSAVPPRDPDAVVRWRLQAARFLARIARVDPDAQTARLRSALGTPHPCAAVADVHALGAVAETYTLTGGTCATSAEQQARLRTVLTELRDRLGDDTRWNPLDPPLLVGLAHLAHHGQVERTAAGQAVDAAVAALRQNPRGVVAVTGQSGPLQVLDAAAVLGVTVDPGPALPAQLRQVLRWQGALPEIPSRLDAEETVLGLRAAADLLGERFDTHRYLDLNRPELTRQQRFILARAFQPARAAEWSDPAGQEPLARVLAMTGAEDPCRTGLADLVRRTGVATSHPAVTTRDLLVAAIAVEAARPCVNGTERESARTAVRDGLRRAERDQHRYGLQGQPPDPLSTWWAWETSCLLDGHLDTDRTEVRRWLERTVAVDPPSVNTTATAIYAAVRLDALATAGCSPPWWDLG